MAHDIGLVLERCRAAIPEWADLADDAFEWEPPKGFSSFTMTVKTGAPVHPRAALYRGLAGKENAIFDAGLERAVFLQLSHAGIAARTHAYESEFRIEEFYDGRTLTPADLRNDDVLRGIAVELDRFHRLIPPDGMTDTGFFDLLHKKWQRLGRIVLTDRRAEFQPSDQELCDELLEMYSDRTLETVRDFLPNSPMTFCHNDTYHGNVMRLTTGEIKLLDFEFSCLNHPAFDFSNLFAETVMLHGFEEPPHFRVGPMEFERVDIARLVGFYLDHQGLAPAASSAELDRLVAETEQMIPLSHFMYAMASIPLALEPMQKIRFLPYAHARWRKFKEEAEQFS